MENCVRCNVSSEKVQLFDCIYNGNLDKICERCSIIENIPLIKKPDPSVLKDSDKNVSVYQRLKRMTGIEDRDLREEGVREKRLREIEMNPELELPIKEKLNLTDHFNWEIMKNRRRKGLSFKQLGQAISESELSLELLEKGKIPQNAEIVIKKIEQFFQINLRKTTEVEKFINNKNRLIRTKPLLLDDEGNVLETIPEPAIDILNENSEEIPIRDEKTLSSVKRDDKMFEMGRPWRRGVKVLDDNKIEYNEKSNEYAGLSLKDEEDLNINKIDSSKVTIRELRDFHRKKILVTKQEKIEEQKKIEERQRLIEARKEELRLLKEKQSKDIDSVLGGSEFLNKKKDNDILDN